MSALAQSRRPQRPRRPPRNLPRTLFRLALPTLVLLPLVGFSTCVRVPTWIEVELKVPRLVFLLNGAESQEVLNKSVPFSSLVVERYKSMVFDADSLAVTEPGKPVPVTAAGSSPCKPVAPWQEVKTRGSLTFLHRDPAAKLTLRLPDSATAQLGVLDRIPFPPGSLVVLAFSPGREPALRVEIQMPQSLKLPIIAPCLEIVADHAKPENVVLPASGSLLDYRVQLPASLPPLVVTSSEQGLDLTVTPPPNQTSQIFREPLHLSIQSVRFEDDQEGNPSSSISETAILTYPSYHTPKTVTLKVHSAVDFSGLRQAQLTSLKLDPQLGTLDARFIGQVNDAQSWDGENRIDLRLTLFETQQHNPSWGVIGVAAAWLVSITWAVYEAWKKLHE